jgi:ATP-binding cassette subfamily C protein
MTTPTPQYTPDSGPFAGVPNRPFVLDGDGVWLVMEGQVDVFAVRLRDGEPAGGRTHVLRAEPGTALFGLGAVRHADDLALLAVGTARAALRYATRAQLVGDAAECPVPAATCAALVDRWVDALCGGIASRIPPQRCDEWAPGQRLRLTKPTSARPRGGVVWVRHAANAHSYLLGEDSMPVNGVGPTPVGRTAWLDVRTACELDTSSTMDALRAGALWDGLDRLHRIVLDGVQTAADRRDEDDRARAARRVATRRAALLQACGQLAQVVDSDVGAAVRRARPASAVPDADDEFLAACGLVAEVMGMSAVAPPRGGGGPPPRDRLAAVARASRFRTRRVALRDDWWLADNGPLLATLAESGRPVALLPLGGRHTGYRLHDPRAAAPVPLTPEVAATVAPIADALYRPFPERALTVWEVLRFGMHGCGRDAWAVVGMSVVAALLGLLPPVVTGAIFNTVIPAAQRSQLLQLTLVLVATACATALFEMTRSVALLRVEGRMSNAVQAAVWDRLLDLPMSFFRPYTAGELASRAMGVDTIRQVVAGTTVAALVSGGFSAAYFGLLFYYSSTLAWWAAGLIACALAVSALGSVLQLSSQRRVFLLQGKASGAVLQLLSNVGKLRVANAEIQAFAAWAARFSEQRRLQFRAKTVGNAVTTFNAAFPVVANMAIYYVALQLLADKQGSLRTGDFLAFMSAFVTCLTSVIATSTALLTCFGVVPLYEQARPILDARPEVDTAKTAPGPLTGALSVQHAVCRYQPEGPAVLRDVSLDIQPGEFVALVGPSGSGKSTLLRVLLGFETLESGAVYYDGQDLAGLDVRAVRRQMGVVLQNGRLLSGDLFTNIVGSNLATIEDAWEAARMAGLDADIRAMPMGMHTVVSEGGGTLSGGQRQRLLIARAIVHRPRVLLFDEATSALDNRTQAVVSTSLEGLQATRIVVAHRLSTVMRADRICVFERGQIVESGTYDELVDRGGLFARLAQRQLT